MTQAHEQWRPVPGYEGDYEVSTFGRVRSHKRRAPRVLSGTVRRGGYIRVQLWRGSTPDYFGVHQLVLRAFVGPRPDGAVTRHLNGDPSDNRLANLAYGTVRENNRDTVRHGTWANQNTAKDRCKRGHPLEGDNLYEHNGRRWCITCKNRTTLEAWHRNKDKYAR